MKPHWLAVALATGLVGLVSTATTSALKAGEDNEAAEKMDLDP
ncbi:MAG TPA: hypothetical protein VMV69_25585 [Pirellulales bacterium]|nr:hypothetical protein [Pirellulales bacterium]